MQWPERGKAGRIGPAQRKSVEGMYVGCRGQGRGSSWAQELWYSQVRVQPVLQRINVMHHPLFPQLISDRALPLLLFPFYVHHLMAISRGRDTRMAIYGAVLLLRSCASKLLV